MSELAMDAKPIRVQRTRRKGGGIPDGAVYVGRPSKWGNPFHTHGDGHKMAPETAVQAFRAQFFGPRADGSYFPNDHPRFRTYRGKRQMEVRELTTVEDIKRELRGKNLACWCPLDKPCHADVLLDIANSSAADRCDGVSPEFRRGPLRDARRKDGRR